MVDTELDSDRELSNAFFIFDISAASSHHCLVSNMYKILQESLKYHWVT